MSSSSSVSGIGGAESVIFEREKARADINFAPTLSEPFGARVPDASWSHPTFRPTDVPIFEADGRVTGVGGPPSLDLSVSTFLMKGWGLVCSQCAQLNEGKRC